MAVLEANGARQFEMSKAKDEKIRQLEQKLKAMEADLQKAKKKSEHKRKNPSIDLQDLQNTLVMQA